MATSDARLAAQALQDIDRTTARMRTTLAYGGTDVILMVWGGIWFLGFLASDLFVRGLVQPAISVSLGAIWMILVLAGIVFSILWGIRYARLAPNPAARGIGMFWFFLYAYIWLATPLLAPFLYMRALQTAEGARHYAALATLVPMFAYVVMGLFLERFFLWIGLAVTALLFVGLYGLPSYFWIWMAFVGGGSLFVPGLIMRLKIRTQMRNVFDAESYHGAA